MPLPFGVTILGSNSALPAHGRHPTAQVITFRDQLFLVDCGEGTQMRMNDYKIHRGRIGHIFISHLHGDHYFGLIGLLNSFGLLQRSQPLTIFGPPPLEHILQAQFAAADTQLPFPLTFTALVPGRSQVLLEEEDLVIEAFPTDHRIDCFGFLFREMHRKRKIDPAKAAAMEVPLTAYRQLQQGQDCQNTRGEHVANSAVTLDPPPARSYAFCADTRYDERLLPHIAGCDLLYHETTYLTAETQNAFRRYHSTGEQAATLAGKAGVKKLLVGHFSSKYPELHPFLEECRPVFPATELAIEGVTYRI